MEPGTLKDLMTVISTVGFPIAAYLIMYMDLRKKIDGMTDAIKQLRMDLLEYLRFVRDEKRA